MMYKYSSLNFSSVKLVEDARHEVYRCGRPLRIFRSEAEPARSDRLQDKERRHEK